MNELRDTDAAYHPSAEEIAAWTRMSLAEVTRVLRPDASVSIGAGGAEGPTDTRVAGAVSVTASATLASALLDLGLTILEPQALFVIVRRYGLDGERSDSLEDLGLMLGVTRERVREIEAAALSILQHRD